MDTIDDNFLDPTHLTIQQAAEYLGVSIQTLRRWDASGKLQPVRHPVSDYRIYRRADLEPFRVEYRIAEKAGDRPSIFTNPAADIEDNPLLRDPQREAHRATREYFSRSRGHVILQIPVGCGKTGVMGTLPFGISTGRVLIITPNTTIRKGVSDNLDVANSNNFLRRTKILPGFTHGPFLAVLDGPNANVDDCVQSDFVVTNIQQLASSADRWLPKFPPNFFDLIMVDEGHHNVAPSWRKVFERFPDAKVVSLTATPFRGDQQPVAGEVIYRYSFTRAMINGYIKQIHSSNVAPKQIYFTYRGEERRHSLDEVLALREEQWFRKGVALSPECNKHIVDASIQKLRAIREGSETKHQVIASACSVDHARQIRALYTEKGLSAMEIHSDMEDEEKAEVLDRLRRGVLDVIVQVQMLGEGFDHPPLSVAAIFRPYRSLPPYIQFVGRVMRVIKEGQPGHADNHGYIVSHVGLNNDANWEEFRELDTADQEMFQAWLRETADEEADGEKGGGSGQPRRFDVGMQVSNEILGQFVNDQFLDLDDDSVIDQMLAVKVLGGLTLGQIGSFTRETLRERLKSLQPPGTAITPEEIPVSPQKRRQYFRKRLSERTGSVTARILQELSLSGVGRQIRKSTDNRQAVTELLNRAINRFLGIAAKERNKMTGEQAEKAFNSLDSIADQVRDELRKSVR